jgi:hypothetical protein
LAGILIRLVAMINLNVYIYISGSRCDVLSFDNTDQLNSKIVCEAKSSKTTKIRYAGNRGIYITRDNVSTSFASLDIILPSKNSQKNWFDAASFKDTGNVSVTVWLTGFLTPARSSDYIFSLKTNGVAKLFLTTESRFNRVNYI